MATTVTMPQLGETVTEGTILSWAKQPGDTISEDEVLLEISTDKVDTEIPSPAAGIIQEILVPEGETVTVGTPLVIIATPEEYAAGGADASAAAPPASAPEPAPAAPQPPPAPAPQPEPAPATAPTAAPPPPAAPAPATPESSAAAPRRAVLSPVVRKLAAEHNIDLDQVTGTGEGGRITRKDVSRYIDAMHAAAAPPPPPAPPAPTAEVTFEPAAPAAAPVAPTPVAPQEPSQPAPAVPVEPAAGGAESREIPRLRRVIAENMVNAKRTTAHVWTAVEVDYERVAQVRSRHKAAWKEREGHSLTYLPFIARATIDALGAYPVVNSSFDLEAGTQTFHSSVGLGIAVDLNQGGLVVMTIPGADGLGLTGLSRSIRAVAEKARGGKLELDDLSGSTFTITNPGPFGSFMSAPIINMPNAAILSTDAVVKRPTVVTLPDGSDVIAIHHIGYLGLTWDHRVFDGSTAVLFLRRIKENLETWDWEQELA
jgi:pyruvate dehydrogenase E2 component (dihydrolipoamide acetyltransferase)